MLKISKVLLGLVVASGIAFASPTSEFSEQGISKTDSEFLFKNNSVNVVALSSDEMKATEGEWINVAIWAGYRGYQVWNRYGKPVNRSLRYGVFSSYYTNWR